MALRTPVTKKAVKNHFAYGWWKYALLILVSIFGWDLLYTTTAYRPPENKKIEFYATAPGATQERMDELMAVIWQEALPDMEQVSAAILMGSEGGTDVYGNMQLSVYIMAGEADVYMLSYSDFYNFGKQGAFLPLDEYVKSGALQRPQEDMSRYTLTIEEDESETPVLLGVPIWEYKGWLDYGIDPSDKVLCVLYRSGNNDNAVKFIDYLMKNISKETPEWFLEAQKQMEASQAQDGN